MSSPAIRISAWAELRTDVLVDHAIVVRMSGLRHCPGLFGAVGDEGLLTSNGDELPTHLRQQVGPVCLEPVTVQAGTLILGLEARDLVRARDFLDDELRLVLARAPGNEHVLL